MAERLPRTGAWLTRILSENLDISGDALRILSPDGDTADQWVFLRRAVEHDFGRADQGGITDEMLRIGAESLRQLGERKEAAVMDHLAAAGSELASAELDWEHRYDARPLTSAEHRDLDLLAAGRIRPGSSHAVTGVDGAVYAPAVVTPSGGGETIAIVAISDAGTFEIISEFTSEQERKTWLADRRRGRGAAVHGLPESAAPLAACAAGPDCQVRREERALAWLLNNPADPGETGWELTAQAFSTHSRAEIFLAWHHLTASQSDPPLGEIRHELARRLLRAPAWAAAAVGWPFGQIGLRYFDRLAATPVTWEEGLTAIFELVHDPVLDGETPAGQEVAVGDAAFGRIWPVPPVTEGLQGHVPVT